MKKEKLAKELAKLPAKDRAAKIENVLEDKSSKFQEAVDAYQHSNPFKDAEKLKDSFVKSLGLAAGEIDIADIQKLPLATPQEGQRLEGIIIRKQPHGFTGCNPIYMFLTTDKKLYPMLFKQPGLTQFLAKKRIGKAVGLVGWGSQINLEQLDVDSDTIQFKPSREFGFVYPQLSKENSVKPELDDIE